MPTKQIEPELFENSIEANGAEDAAVELEHWMWAERVIREVSEEATSEERNRRDFIRAFLRWEEIVGFLNFVEIGMIRSGMKCKSKLSWHEGLCTILMTLGHTIKSWAETYDFELLELAGYSDEKHSSLMESLKDSYELWHTEESLPRSSKILSLINFDGKE